MVISEDALSINGWFNWRGNKTQITADERNKMPRDFHGEKKCIDSIRIDIQGEKKRKKSRDLEMNYIRGRVIRRII